jgi:hypothetical protein
MLMISSVASAIALLMIDSGAYSVFQGRIEIKLPDYIRFIEDNRDVIDLFVSLDVIPGKDGRRFTDVKAAEQSYRNHQIMKDRGLRPLPVHHRQDPFRFLERHLANNERYICLAGHPIRHCHLARSVLRLVQRPQHQGASARHR